MINTFEGLRSRWTNCAECIYFKALRIWNRMKVRWFAVKMDYLKFLNEIPNKWMQIGLHVLKDQVHIALVCGLDDFVEFDNIFMFHLMEEGDFSVGSLGICWVLKSIKYFFEGKSLLWFFIDYFPYMAIGSTSKKFFGLIKL